MTTTTTTMPLDSTTAFARLVYHTASIASDRNAGQYRLSSMGGGDMSMDRGPSSSPATAAATLNAAILRLTLESLWFQRQMLCQHLLALSGTPRIAVIQDLAHGDEFVLVALPSRSGLVGPTLVGIARAGPTLARMLIAIRRGAAAPTARSAQWLFHGMNAAVTAIHAALGCRTSWHVWVSSPAGAPSSMDSPTHSAPSPHRPTDPTTHGLSPYQMAAEAA